MSHVPSTLSILRRKVLSSIRRQLRPVVRSCGFVGVRLITPKPRRNGERPLIRLPGVRLPDLETCYGISTEGPVTDAYGGGCVISYWRGIPLEDLFVIDAYLKRALPAQLLV